MLKPDMTSEEFWAWWGRTSPQYDRKEKPVLCPRDGPVAPGGSKSGKIKKKKKLSDLKPYLLE